MWQSDFQCWWNPETCTRLGYWAVHRSHSGWEDQGALLPAAVDVVDLVVLVERYGLQAVGQRAVQHSDA